MGRRIVLLDRVASRLIDARAPFKVKHDLASVLLSSHYPLQDTFRRVYLVLNSS